MNSSKRILPALLALAVSCAATVVASAVTLTSNNVVVSVDSTAGAGSSTFNGTSIPTSHLLDATVGAYYSRTRVDYTGSGDNVTLMSTLNQKRSGDFLDISRGLNSALYFTVAANSSYTLSGAYSAVDVTTAGSLSFASFLYDLTTSSYLFENAQGSKNTLNESFVLGGTGGDTLNFLVGSLTGSLIAGHNYVWYSDAITNAAPDADGGATTTGFFRLDIAGDAPPAVPDGGATLALLGLSVAALAACRRPAARAEAGALSR